LEIWNIYIYLGGPGLCSTFLAENLRERRSVIFDLEEALPAYIKIWINRLSGGVGPVFKIHMYVTA
jgi:hypothetical protein